VHGTAWSLAPAPVAAEPAPAASAHQG